jgi:hypothetical protein
MSRTGTLGCANGAGTCTSASFVEAESSDFHDQTLILASAGIRAVLTAIPPDPGGRKLSFIHTDMGTLLAWATHDETAPIEADAITADHDRATVAAALGLKNINEKSSGFLRAEESDFHDQTLIFATALIRAVLAAIPPDPGGRKLSFIHTDLGTLLAWATHDEAAPMEADAITAKHDRAAVAKALRLKNLETSGYAKV